MTCLISCVGKIIRFEPASSVARTPEPTPATATAPLPARTQKTIELSREKNPQFQEEKTKINAEFYRPESKLEPKVLVILVPGTGKVSRRGEMSSDGINKYQNTVSLYDLWARELSSVGFYVFAYDKRTCRDEFNQLCVHKDRNSADEQGIEILARDLDDIYDFALEALKKIGQENTARIVLMGHTQSAQVIAQSARAKYASGIVLLSPIAEGLDAMMVRGFERAHRRNDAEGQKAFFERLEKGQLGENAIFFGASVKLWKSWLDASRRTMPLLKAHQLPILMLFSEKDVFSSAAIARESIKEDSKKNFIIKNIADDADRNLLENNSLAKKAVAEVVHFAKNLKPLTPQ